MNKVDLENVKENDLIRYQHCMSSRNMYDEVEKITKAYIILKDGRKFRKKDGWGASQSSGYHVSGINDHEECREEDLLDMYYY